LRPGGGFSFNGALRYDHVDGGRGRVTGRAAAAWQANARAPSLFARIGQGYKLPSFYALAHPLIGNPDLRPERSTNEDLGIEQRIGAASFLRLTLFQNRFRDLVDFDPLLFRTVNRDRVRARGAELEGSWAVRPALRLDGSLAWLDLESPTPLRNRPHWQGSLRAAWQAAKALELNAALRGNSSFFDSSIPTGLVTAHGHVEADLGLRYRLSPRLVFAAALRNLTDRHWQDAVGFPAPGRLVRASLAVELF
jgi:iron complex outermembrane receptor protein/vitamin B12 transporter